MMTKWSSHLKKYDNCVQPIAEVSIAGKAWSSETILITNIDVSLSVGPEASTCTVEFSTTLPDVEDGTLSIDDDFAKVKLGVDIEISLGYFAEGLFGLSAEVTEVFIGYVCDIEIKVREGKQAVLIVKGMDAKVWMMPSQIIELKKEKTKISDVVADTLSDFSGKIKGKTIKIDGEPELERPIWQMNESHYEFLCRLAELSGCFFYISLGKLYFTSVSELQSDGVELSPGVGIHELDVTISIWGQHKEVTHVSLDPKDFTKKIESKVTSSSITKYGDGKAPTSLTSNISASCARSIVDYSIASAAEAKFRSEALYNKTAIDLVQGKFLVAGIPDITVASGLETSDCGEPIDNTYIITKIQHHCNISNREYTTEIEASSSKVNPLTASLLSLF
ncbi:MAG: hypothetical protein LBR79_04155 [Oscillospiraceae bacterium]|jgi:phage protein D|nr:hypothetical protein [Oscillospiraceae bacterium]